MNPLASLLLMAAWQACFLAVVIRRHAWLGFAALGYSIVWVGLMLWADALVPEVTAVLLVVEVAMIAAVYWRAPRTARVGSSAFGLIGVLLAAVGWLGAGGRHWHEVVAAVVLIGILMLALGLFLTGRGRFELRGQPTRPFIQSGSIAPFRYTYWSQRAIDDLTSDTSSQSRPAVKSFELGLPILGLKVILEQAAVKSGRHAVATKIEQQFSEHIHADAAKLADTDNALLAGFGTIYVTAWGSAEAGPAGTGRVTLFADYCENGVRVAVCLFGSMDNFDRSIQDIRPENVKGLPNSAALDVLAWIEENKQFPGRWREPVGKVAYKIASPYREMPLPAHNYARVAVMNQKYSQWFAHIYESYSVELDKDVDELPFDLVLVGRPIWVRARYVSINPGADTEQREFEELYLRYWKKMLGLNSESRGWPVHLYRFLLARQGVKFDL